MLLFPQKGVVPHICKTGRIFEEHDRLFPPDFKVNMTNECHL